MLNEGHERRHNGPVDEGGEVPGGLADVGLRLDPVLSDPEPRPVDLLLHELKLGWVLQNAIVT